MNKVKQKKVRENQKLTNSSEISMDKKILALAGAIPFNCFVRAADSAKAMAQQEARKKSGMLDIGIRYHTAAERHGNYCTSFPTAKHERQTTRELVRWSKLVAQGKARVVNGCFEIIPVRQRILLAA